MQFMYRPAVPRAALPGRTRALAANARYEGPRIRTKCASMANGRDETPEQALERRLRESRQAEDRTTYVSSVAEWQQELTQAGKKLVVLEVESETVCDTGIPEHDNVEYQYNAEARAMHAERMARCRQIKHSFQRIARDCEDTTFLQHTIGFEPTAESEELCAHLGIEVLPTLQFWRNGRKLWEHRGAIAMESGIGEGVLYYEGSAAEGEHVTDHVGTIKSKRQFAEFVLNGPKDELQVVMVATQSAAPCIHVYPAVLALAKNFKGYASFARMVGDTSPELAGMMADLNILEVPTFMFFRGGKEIARHVGSSRADLIGQIMTLQSQQGITPPTPQRPSRPIPHRTAVPQGQARRSAWQ